ncbi:hypothetical protein INT43_007147 [Umbelopsis isabellina]|uniref:Uncharacterized protein n=1 Tax=Mortierella isabellina TaxID=91625 RepID=A0A8H7PYT6_MORIS|nr:hypothetical protein INT43_007147 [Umbelopsis isabellina]
MSTSHFHLPYGYVEAPPWPSLYWPFGPNFNPLSLIADIPHSLYYMKDIWRFTVLWSLIFAIAVYFPAGKAITDIINDRRIKLLAPNNNLDHNQRHLGLHDVSKITHLQMVYAGSCTLNIRGGRRSIILHHRQHCWYAKRVLIL